MIEFIAENALILIPVLNVLGSIIKDIEKIPNKFIPLILTLFGVLGSVAVLGLSAESVLQGILVTGAAVYGNQLVKQFTKKENTN